MAANLHVHTSALPNALDPLSALDRVASSAISDITLLHSGHANGISILAWDPLCKLTVDADSHPTVTGDIPTPNLNHLPPLEALDHLVNDIELTGHDLPSLIGWLGFISYDIAHTLEHIPPHATDDLHWPLLHFTLFRHYALFQNATTTLFTLSPDANAPTPQFPPPAPTPHPATHKPRLLHAQSRNDYLEKIRRVQNYIAAGDIYQANLAQRWIVETPDSPLHIFRRLCHRSPAPFASFLRFTDQQRITRHVLSASPELFLTLDGGHLITRPIKGTRPRDLLDPRHDAALRDQLLASEKDQAELAMIVDLLRNDLGRVSRYGTVHVTAPRTLEQHPTLWHTVATIESDLRQFGDAGANASGGGAATEFGASLAELLAAVCPGGSITGAPKIRAMQIIEELEGFRRALYCGNIGVIAPQARSLALNIAIRTILLQQGKAYLYAGGGIVADSQPAQEFEETHHKAAALFHALGIDPPPPFTP